MTLSTAKKLFGFIFIYLTFLPAGFSYDLDVCPTPEPGYIRPVIDSRTENFISWNNASFEKCYPYDDQEGGIHFLLTLGDPVQKCGKKVFNKDFSIIFATTSTTNQVLKYRTRRTSVATNSPVCSFTENTYKLLGFTEMTFHIEMNNNKFSLRSISSITREKKRIKY